MGLLGTLVKSGIDLTHKLQRDTLSGPELQEQQLRHLLEKSADTAFGKYYGFPRMLEEKDIIGAFQREVPLHTYEQLHEKWWSRQQRLKDITWPGMPEFFARSSGTTGKTGKRIMVTDDFLKSVRDTGRSMVESLANFDFPKPLFESEILMLSSSANLEKTGKNQSEGEISGINVSNFPDWYDLFYRPGKEIAAIDDWDERIARIAEEAPSWNIGAIAGIPSWVLIMLQEIVKKHGLSSIHDIWPNLMVYASGGVAFETYRKDFEKLFSRPVTIMDTYLASEGFIAYTARPGTMSMQLALSHGYFYEFIPFDERGVDEMGQVKENAECHRLENVEKNQDYVLVISTCAGAWRYLIGDTITFTSLEPYEIRITGRTKFYLNVTGSQLSEEKLDDAVLHVSEQLDCSINEYMVAAVRNEQDQYIHQWVIVSDSPVDEDHLARSLDKALRSSNKNYEVARKRALQDVRVRRISKRMYHDQMDKAGKKGGQVKIRKVMTEKQMNHFLNTLESVTS